MAQGEASKMRDPGKKGPQKKQEPPPEEAK